MVCATLFPRRCRTFAQFIATNNKMMNSRAHGQQPEFEMEFIVAEREHPMLMQIVEHMVSATEDKAMKGFFEKGLLYRPIKGLEVELKEVVDSAATRLR